MNTEARAYTGRASNRPNQVPGKAAGKPNAIPGFQGRFGGAVFDM
jgi:hypothetical protein